MALTVVVQVSQNARPAEDVATCCDSRADHFRAWLHTDGTSRFGGVEHVDVDFDHRLPVDRLVPIVESLNVIRLGALDVFPKSVLLKVFNLLVEVAIMVYLTASVLYIV